MTDGKSAKDPTLVERWIEDQREWQKTAMAYLDSMVKNDEFLVHMGNAMRGSLLAGKPYPTAPAPGAAPAQDPPPDDRLDQVLFALHQVQGQLNDLRMTLDEMRNGAEGSPPTMPATPKATTARAPRPTKAAPRARARKTRPGRARG